MLKSLLSRFRSSSTVLDKRGPMIEGLEGRQLMSASVGGVIVSPTPTPTPIVIPIIRVLQVEPVNIAVGKKWAGVIAKYDPATSIPLPSPDAAYGIKLVATVSWGDGSTGPATVVTGKDGVVSLYSNHVYDKVGTYTTNVTLEGVPYPTKPGGPIPQFIVLLAEGSGTATVTGQLQQGLTIYPEAGQSYTGAVAKLNFAVPPPGGPAPLQFYQATISWGDGTYSPGTFALDTATGDSDVIGTHTYAKAGTYKIHVEVTFGPPLVWYLDKSGVSVNNPIIIDPFPIIKVVADIDSTADVLSTGWTGPIPL